ncbi:hypothetical protein J4471_03975 [Candidatus Woesearchaeota archaeon]|nr:hypothetical protein [Candidatus Woesearchaeota archaeon]
MKLFSLEKVYNDTAELFLNIHESKYFPNVIGSVYRGGCSIIAPTIIDLYKAVGHNDFYHTSFKASSYNRPGERKKVQFEGLGSLKERIRDTDKVLILEDIIDEGRTFERIMQELRLVSNSVRFAVLYWRKDKNENNLVPDYYVEEVDDWINFPHEISDLADENLDLIQLKGGPWVEIAGLLRKEKNKRIA